jgi:hypothetical protein
MNVAQQLGIVESTGEKGLIKTVKTIQEYALLREIRPSVIDFYFLVFGEQEWAKQFVIKKPSD